MPAHIHTYLRRYIRSFCSQQRARPSRLAAASFGVFEPPSLPREGRITPIAIRIRIRKQPRYIYAFASRKGLPCMTSTKCWDFLPPHGSSPLFSKFMYCFDCKFGRFFDPLPFLLLCGRHIWKPPNGGAVQIFEMDRFTVTISSAAKGSIAGALRSPDHREWPIIPHAKSRFLA